MRGMWRLMCVVEGLWCVMLDCVLSVWMVWKEVCVVMLFVGVPSAVYVYYAPTLPEGPPPSDKPEELKLGVQYHVPPKTFGLRLGFGWDAPEGLDLDASAALFNSNKCKMDYVWWDNPKSSDESVTFISKDDTQGLSSGDKEVIGVEMDHLANEVAYIVLSVSVYSKGKTLRDNLKSLSLRGFDSEAGDKELFTYKIDGDHRGTTVTIGVLVREGAWFKFVPLRQPMLSRTVSEIAYEPSNLDPAFAIKAVPLERRVMKMSVKKGRNLTPMDISLFKKRSDPYLKIFYRGKTFQSEVAYSTLAPTYTMEPLDVGEIVECDDDIIDIQVRECISNCDMHLPTR